VAHSSVISTTLKVAGEIGADLLAAGSHSQKVIDRLIIGSTAAQLLRAARCSVFIAPPSDEMQ
jgi:nucleotide-binding universal stress UspA family protein